MVEIYTDGACKGNPGPGGWGAVILNVTNEPIHLNGAAPNTTNNQMELTAVIEALKSTPAGGKIRVYSDSEYVIQGAMDWMHRWAKNGWRTARRKPVMNKELWSQLLECSKLHTIKWVWVKGHNGNEFNELADRLANSAIKQWRAT